MHYKDLLIQYINHNNLNHNNSVNFYIPGKNNRTMLYSAAMHKNILSFYDVDVDHLKFVYKNANQNWVGESEKAGTEPDVKTGDILLILPNSTISQHEILSKIRGLQLREIVHTQSSNYFEIPEMRHFLKYIMLIKNPSLLGARMVYREVDYAIFEVL